MAVDREGRTPKKVTVLAERLRERILSGEWRDGDPVPSQAQLVEEYKVSTETVRGAVELLVGEALIHKRHGMPSLVTYRDPAHRLLLVRGGMPDERLEEAPAVLTEDPRAGAGERVSFERLVDVPARFVGLLGLEPGRAMTERTIRLEVDGEPVLTSISYVPAELTGEDGQEWRDVEVGRLALVGYPVTAEPGRVHARPPSPAERVALGMHRGPSLAVVGRRYRVRLGEETVAAGVVVLARGDRVFVERELP